MAIQEKQVYAELHTPIYDKYFEQFSEKLWNRDYDEELNDTRTNRMYGVFPTQGPRTKTLLNKVSDATKIEKIQRELKEIVLEDETLKNTREKFTESDLDDLLNFIANEYNGASRTKFKKAGRANELSNVEISGLGNTADKGLNEREVATVKAAGGEVLQTALTPEERARASKEFRLGEQAALMLTIEELLQKSSKTIPDKDELIFTDKRYKNLSPIIYSHSDERPEPTNIEKLKLDLQKRKSISDASPRRKTRDNTPTGHFSLTNFFTKHKSMDVFFRKLPPQVLSFLVPSIKMYKTFYPVQRGGKTTPKEGSKYGCDWRIPFDDVPISYEDDTSGFVAKSAESVLNGNGSLHSVGIKSFSYQYKGVNPAEINTNISARLELFFQNPAELVKKIPVNWNDVLNVKENSNKELQTIFFQYSDLINQVALKNKINDEEYFNDQYYRIKIECGYAEVNEKILRDVLDSADIKDKSAQDEVLNAIRSTKVMLYLSPYKYDISFKEDSTISLTIDYISSMDSVLASPDADLFKVTSYSRNLKSITDQFENFLKAREILKDSSKLTEQETTREEQKNIITEFKQKYSNRFSDIESVSDEEVSRELNKIRNSVYNGLYDVLIGKELLTGYDGKKENTILPKVYFANFKPHILGIKTEEDLSNVAQRIKILNDGDQIQSVEPIVLDEEVLIPATDKEDGGSENDPVSSVNERTLRKIDASALTCVIKFVYLGDILDVAFDCLNYISPVEEAPRVILGNIPFGIPIDRDSSGLREVNPNLAHIPISLSLFQEFMIINIVKKKRTTYPILEFMKDILSQLVFPAISPSILGNKYAINAQIRFSTGYFSFPTVNGKDPITDLPLDQRNFPPIINKGTISRLQKLRDKDDLHFSSLKSRLRAANYIFIVCSSQFPNYIKGNEQEDIQNGLFHVRMGTETGLVQKINFKTVSIPFLREMLASKEGDGKATTLKQYYNAEIEMFGNDIFRPGDFLYIHPNYMYVSKDTDGNKNAPSSISLEDGLGIGGYYLVLDVETSISDMSYKTRIKCVFQAIKKDGKLITIHQSKAGAK